MAVAETAQRKRAASLEDLRAAGRLVVHLDGHTICLFADGGEVHAVDNRCPHMGFPLHRGTVSDGILTCHWHHARFDLLHRRDVRPVGRRRCALPGARSRATTSTST